MRTSLVALLLVACGPSGSKVLRRVDDATFHGWVHRFEAHSDVDDLALRVEDATPLRLVVSVRATVSAFDLFSASQPSAIERLDLAGAAVPLLGPIVRVDQGERFRLEAHGEATQDVQSALLAEAIGALFYNQENKPRGATYLFTGEAARRVHDVLGEWSELH